MKTESIFENEMEQSRILKSFNRQEMNDKSGKNRKNESEKKSNIFNFKTKQPMNYLLTLTLFACSIIFVAVSGVS